ncbi:discoidin domain-containing protein [Actinomadura viridis]|uniref:alpha-L-rhamnosidase-related protein n=1 Tax=Actinomadura viridis TaxID=58110 RepID=UPI00368F1A2F
MDSLSRRTVLRSTASMAFLAGTTALVSRQAAQAAPVPLTARWIWPGAGAANQWAAFRRTITLPAVPSSARTRIAADSKYWLYVNGELVVFEGGLKRGPNPDDTYVDELDLAPHLKAGDNTIAVLAWYFGKQGFSHKDSGRAGLLLQSDIVTGGTTTRLVSDAGWKAVVHPGYGADASGGQPNYRLPESNIHYDARAATAMAGWETPGYDDGAWRAATDVAAAGAAPWNALVPRPIPFFRISGLRDYTNADDLPAAGGEPIDATLPSNVQITPYLKVDAPAGAVIEIQTDHYQDGGEKNLRATYITTGGVQEFESLGWLSGTSVTYRIPAGVKILALKYRESGYDTDFAGSFSSNDAFFNVLWGKAARTMYLNMRDTYFDCPTRERAQWWGDVVNQLKEGFYTFDPRSHDLGRKAISELAGWQKPDGVMYSPVPAGNWVNELPPQTLASVWTFSTFHAYTGDAATVSATYPQVKKYLNLWSFDSDGLIRHRAGGWDWADWGGNIDARILDNAWYYLALESAITLARLAGAPGDVATWQERRERVKANFDRVLWNSARKEYRSPGYTGDTDDRGNALAVVAGLADPANHPAITSVLRTHLNASPYMEFYVLEALYLMGAVHVAETRMRTRYASQVADPGYTLWEVWDKNGGTDNHAWNGGPLYVLSAYGAGVRPTAPGWKTYDVVPWTGSFTRIDTVTPTVRGDIGVRIDRGEDTVALRLTSPRGTTARVGVPVYRGSRPVIKANGRTVYKNGRFIGRFSGLSFAGADAEHVYFTAGPGTWTFNATRVGRLGNIAAGRRVTGNSSEESGNRGLAQLTDSLVTAVGTAKGFSSEPFPSPDASAAPVWVEIDLGGDSDIDGVSLFPRTDITAAGGGTPGFPVDFTISTRKDGAANYTVARTVTGEADPEGDPRTYDFAKTTARYVRVQATRLGKPASDEPERFRLQLTELEVHPARITVTSNDSLENPDWGISRLIDGITTSVPGAKGYTSNLYRDPDIAGSPIWVEIDLGADRTIGAVTLHPRTDITSADGGSPGFPVDFTIRTRKDGADDYTTVHTATGHPNPGGSAGRYTFDQTRARYVRLQVTRLGPPAKDEPSYYRLQLAEMEPR